MRSHPTFSCLGFCLAAHLAYFAAAVPAQAQDARGFLFIGDLPYNDKQSERLTIVIADAIAKSGFPFLVHYGDFKGGSVACGGESELREAFAAITALMPVGATPRPVFYTPGDNEWTDCDRRFKSGEAKSELAQLELLRQVFFLEAPLKLPDAWQYRRQPLYPENALWRFGGVQFATLHLVGTNNGRLSILMDDVALALAQVEARDQANRVWLNAVFEAAENFRDPAAAVIVTTQADVTDPDEAAPCTPANPMNCDAYAGFRAQLAKHAAAFKKPVLLVHGDTGPYCLDQGFGGAAAPKLWRLNAGGDFHEPLDATVVTFHPGNSDGPFSVKGLVEGEAPAAGC